MCGRVFQTLGTDQLIRLAGAALCRNGDRYSASYNVCPTSYVPTIRYNPAGKLRGGGPERELHLLKWGYAAPFGQFIINARCEELQEKRTFIPLLNKSRCIIMAEGYYEWTPKKEPWVFRHKDYKKDLSDGENPPCFFIAALLAPDESVILLTREARPEVAHVHDRMPVFLDESEIDMWINTDEYKFEKIIDKYILNEKSEKWNQLAYYRIGPCINDLKNKTSDCLMSVDEHKQKLDKTGIKKFFTMAQKKIDEKKANLEAAKNSQEESKEDASKKMAIEGETTDGMPPLDDVQKAQLEALSRENQLTLVVVPDSKSKGTGIKRNFKETPLGHQAMNDCQKTTKLNSKDKKGLEKGQTSLLQMIGNAGNANNQIVPP